MELERNIRTVPADHSPVTDLKPLCPLRPAQQGSVPDVSLNGPYVRGRWARIQKIQRSTIGHSGDKALAGRTIFQVGINRFGGSTRKLAESVGA